MQRQELIHTTHTMISDHLFLTANLVISGVDADQTIAALLAIYSMQLGSSRDDAENHP